MAKAKLKKDLDKIFSLYIRLRDSDERGYCKCFTCGVVKFYKEVHNGHYISRTCTATRFDERNCNVQCVGCNMFKEGARDEYALNLIKKYGKKILTDLNKAKYEIVKYSDEWYIEKIEHYKKEVERLKKLKNLP